MIQALESQQQMADVQELPFEDRFGLIVDAELASRDNRSLQSRLTKARLRQAACIEDLDFKTSRGLDRAVIASLATSVWVGQRHNVLICGPTGSGKSFVACALAQKACRDGHTAAYHRASKLFHELAIAKSTGKYGTMISSISKKDVLVIDDFGLSALNDEQRHDLLELVEERYERKSLIIASQLPIEKWHEVIGDPTIADAILDRIVHNAYKLSIKAKKSMRESRTGDLVA
jgi:DNA replication protein DnaC